MPQSKQKAKAAAKQRVRSAADAAEEKAKQAASKKASRKAPVGAAVDEAPPPTPPLPARASRKRKPSARQQDAAAAMEEAADDSDDDALAVPVYDDDDDDEGSDDVEPREAPARRVAADADRRLSEADIMRLADEMMAKQLQARLNRGEDEGQPDAMEQDHQGKKLGGDETAETRAFAKAGEVAASARDGTDALRMLQVWGKPGDVAKFLAQHGGQGEGADKQFERRSRVGTHHRGAGAPPHEDLFGRSLGRGATPTVRTLGDGGGLDNKHAGGQGWSSWRGAHLDAHGARRGGRLCRNATQWSNHPDGGAVAHRSQPPTRGVGAACETSADGSRPSPVVDVRLLYPDWPRSQHMLVDPHKCIGADGYTRPSVRRARRYAAHAAQRGRPWRRERGAPP